MFASTYAMCTVTLLAILVPLAMGGKMVENPITKEKRFEVPNPTFGYVLTALRYLCMLGFYGGAAGVIYAIFVFKADSGPTQPVSPAVHCVVNLTFQFFFVYALLNIMVTIGEITHIKMEEYKIF